MLDKGLFFFLTCGKIEERKAVMTVKKCVIFCAGEFHTLAEPLDGAFIIAADGGYAHTQKLGITPDLILGDFDSLGFVPTGANVHPVEKDDTDAMLAIRAGLEAGCTDFVIYGALDGPRLDHTVANLQSLLYLAAHGARGTLIGLNNIITTVRNETLVFPGDFAGTVSLFTLGKPAKLTIRGLKYELEDGCLTPDFPLGVSNHFLGAQSSVTVKDGCVLAILDTANGMRWRYE